MKKVVLLAIVSVALTIGLGGCDKRTAGTVGGAAVGATVGGLAGGTTGAVIGGVVGGVAGNQLSK